MIGLFMLHVAWKIIVPRDKLVSSVQTLLIDTPYEFKYVNRISLSNGCSQ